MSRKEWRIFNHHKYFVIANLYDTKAEANIVAEHERHKGNFARITKDRYGYRVYRRRK
jgi:hypothetical protein